MLEAVHLLLALDLFVVVVGVDPRWLLRSLREQYPGLLDAGVQAPVPGGDALSDATTADYLEKIFNIPFVLPGFPAARLGELVRGMNRARSGQRGRRRPGCRVLPGPPSRLVPPAAAQATTAGGAAAPSGGAATAVSPPMLSGRRRSRAPGAGRAHRPRPRHRSR